MLVEMTGTVQIRPHTLNKGVGKAIVRQLGKTYADTVVPGVGLVVAIHKVTSTEDALIHPGKGGTVQYSVVFDAIVFRAVKNDILRASIVEVDPTRGVRLSLGFFEDIFVSPDLLPKPSLWSEAHKTWAFNAEPDPDAEPDLHPLEVGAPVFALVVQDHFFDIHKIDPELEVPPTRPYCILGSMQGNGLGPVDWW